MKDNYIELRTRNNFGDILDNYFYFLKHNFKHFINLYLRYNAISIVFTLLASYLLATGFLGLASRDFRFGVGNDTESTMYLGAGGILLVLMLFITTLINLSFSSAYITEYVKTEGKQDSKAIWKSITSNIGKIMVFILLGIVIYIGYFIISMVLAFIPVLGVFVQYGLSFLLSAMFGITFMSIFSTRKDATQALGEGWDFTIQNFLKVMFYGIVIGILNLMITTLILTIPTIIFSAYVYFSAESNIDLTTSAFTSIISTLYFAVFILSFVFSQALSQVAFGVLYYNLHESKYNTYLQSRIDLIGKGE